ncbi:hypothetical protein PILCRDRAFT_821576 [Piloderma croceum F 1598]|uniref:Profilin n=1 Tax=Piloderma croceum (strain F 1598) TaxID=765440 RepID=A0A0C3BV06_PILCF|nr:hypothetical protein PILCRDRAFT_821576 [Piloderma croceum F 1598]
MSWQSYVDTNLLGGAEPKLVEAAILSQNDTGVWAISQGYQAKFTAKEQADIRTAFAVHQLPEGTKEEQAAKAKAVESGVQGNGIRVRGTKFMCTKNTPDSIYGTKKTADGRVIGVIMARTKLAILVAEYEPPHQAGEAAPVVESLAEYLRTANS